MNKPAHWFGLTAVVIVLDQITKQLAENMLQLQQSVAVVPGFNLTLLYNKGAAFSFLSQAGGWQRWLFTLLSTVISIVLITWLLKLDRQQKILAAGLALILGGAVGNLIDRVLFGHVIDFIQVYYTADSCMIGFSHAYLHTESMCIWPAFNIADSAITIGAGLLILDMFKSDKHTVPGHD